MRFAQHTFARVLIWLAAIATPLQGLSAPACGCTKDASVAVCQAESTTACCAGTAPSVCPCTGAKICRCGEKSTCCQAKSGCCSRAGDHGPRDQRHSCCQRRSCCEGGSCCCGQGVSGTGCSCGDNCHCGENDSPNQPATLPVEDNQPERILVAATLSTTVGQAVLATSQQLSASPAELDASMSSIDRCISLCRFRL